MKIEVTVEKFQEIINRGYSLDTVFLLKVLEDLGSLCEGNPKFQAFKQSLLRKGLISEDNKPTLSGEELLNFVSSPSKERLTRKKVDNDGFNLWWGKYPGTDSFEYCGRKFTGTRALRVKKEDCKLKLNKILNEGEYNIDDLVKALDLEVLQKKEGSIKAGQNKLSFMQNSLTYLNQRTFEPFIELSKQGIEIENKPVIGTIDI